MLYVGIYNPPTKWWRRAKTIQITVWPNWLAQWLCPHINRKQLAPFACDDCNKFLGWPEHSDR